MRTYLYDVDPDHDTIFKKFASWTLVPTPAKIINIGLLIIAQCPELLTNKE